MDENHFDKLIKQNKERRALAIKDAKSIQDELIECSVNFNGSSLSKFFNKQNIGFCMDFLESMKRHGYPRASELELKSLRSKRPLTKSEMALGPWSVSLTRKLKNRYLWTRLWRGQGYCIGVIKKENNVLASSCRFSNVYLCTDGLLRCERSEPLFNESATRAYGYGSIPKNSLMPGLKLYVGEFRDDYSGDAKVFEEVPIKVILEKYVTNL